MVHQAKQLGLEGSFQRCPEGEQRRLPLPRVVHTVEGAVVQLVAAVERELDVLVGQHVAVRRRPSGQLVGRLHEPVEQVGAERPARTGERAHGSAIPRAMTHKRQFERSCSLHAR